MNLLKSALARVSAWVNERRVASRPPARRRSNKASVLCGLIAGLTLGSAAAAHAQVWDFSYSGSGVSASGTFTVGGLVPCDSTFTHTCVSITSITGTHSVGGAITGPWYPSVASGPGFPGTNDTSDAVSMYFTTGGINMAFQYFFATGTGTQYAPCSANSCSSSQPTSVDASVTPHVDAVPEINASAGLEALALLFVFGSLMREMFLRRRFV